MKRALATLLGLAGATAWVSAVLLADATLDAVEPPPGTLDVAALGEGRPRVLARDGTVLSRTYAGEWNVHDRVAPHDVPALLVEAFLAAEDRRFRAHGGVDWRARAAAAVQNALALEVVRGASTISEQVVRMLRPRPRTAWSRWIEGFEAARLEERFGKAAILDFYLNQVPYASNRRGVVQAARHYFDRSLATLSAKEMLALAVLVRAPSRLDPWRDRDAAQSRIARLADALHARGAIDARTRAAVRDRPLALAAPRLALHAPHFVRHARAAARGEAARIRTTLDPDLQAFAQAALDERLRALGPRGVTNGAVVVADHARGEILAWAVAGNGAPARPGAHVDAVLAPRQPGSTLKPFVYAIALERGWTAATVIDDAPLAEPVGAGLHAYDNYGRVHYGPVTVRDALGSSLNVPAVKALAHAGVERTLERLRALGMTSLDAHPDVYGDGLALGNGEVSLLELAGAYAALARGGAYAPLRAIADAPRAPARHVLAAPVASIVADVLADPDARALEFGTGGVLRFPHETAVKTGTSNAHRDAWTVAFDHRYVVAAWTGNLDRRPSDRVTGAKGPALVVRSIVARLARRTPPRPLARDPRLVRRETCVPRGGAADAGCARRTEWFAPGTAAAAAPAARFAGVRVAHPSAGLRLALDPRIADADERFRFALAPGPEYRSVEWYVDGSPVGRSDGPTWLWPLARGMHEVVAVARVAGLDAPVRTAPVRFEVR